MFPQSPGKIWSPAPPTKGTLNETVLVTQFLLPTGSQWPSTQTYVTSTTAPSCGGFLDSAAAFKKLRPPMLAPPAFSVPLSYFYSVTDFAFGFHPLLQEPTRLVNAWFTQTYSKVGATAQAQLRVTLLKLAKAVQARAAVTNEVLPEYRLLDPSKLPFKMYI